MLPAPTTVCPHPLHPACPHIHPLPPLHALSTCAFPPINMPPPPPWMPHTILPHPDAQAMQDDLPGPRETVCGARASC